MAKCEKPLIGIGQTVFPCGRCLSCKINKRRIWTNRIILEARLHTHNTFVTLTYSDAALSKTQPENLESSHLATLIPEHLSAWLKRLRKAISPSKIRFFGVGEYADDHAEILEWGRPHYHAAVFGLPGCHYGATRYRRPGWPPCCPQCELVSTTWGHGLVYLGEITPESAQYIAGYTIKKMTHAQDTRLEGRAPEFARMSLKPGIGHGMMEQLAPLGLDPSTGDVPSAVRHGPKILPLGRYLKNTLRQAHGLPKNTPRETLLQWDAEKMLPLRILAKNTDTPLAKILELDLGNSALQIKKRQSLQRKR